jgi:hypothetical protein
MYFFFVLINHSYYYFLEFSIWYFLLFAIYILSGGVGFQGRAVALLLHVSALRFTHLRFLVCDSNPLCSFSWGFVEDYGGLGAH